MNPVELKRQILIDSERLGFRKKVAAGDYQDSGLTNDDIVEIGIAFESMTEHKGWTYLEAYILKHADPVALLFDDDNPGKKGEAKGLIKLMQYIDQIIKAKNDIQEKEKTKNGKQ